MSLIESAKNKFAKGKEWRLTEEKFNQLLDELKLTLYSFVPPGHFYSPIPDLTDVISRQGQIWNSENKVPGLDINHDLQYQHINHFFDFSATIPFTDDKTDGVRYYYLNQSYSYADAITLHSMIRMYKPKRIIEVGSGHSSCVMLDTNDLFFNGKINMTFIEPYPEFFFSLISDEDKHKNIIIDEKLQDVSLEIFETLEKDDILFIDSSHVSKINSDVNRIFFEILPSLKEGVIVHFHDIFYPFEYPFSWVQEGRAWNEIYILRAFMQYNSDFEILFMSTYASLAFKNEISKSLPDFLKNHGGNFWIRKKVKQMVDEK